MPSKIFGTAVARKEDPALVRGAGTFLDDIVLSGMLHVVLLRSTVPHGIIRTIDFGKARSVDGVVDVVDAGDLGDAASPFPLLLPHKGLAAVTWSALARGIVRFVGEPIAAVIAESRNAALDAVERISVEYEELPAVLDIEEAVKPGSPLLHESAPNNLAMHIVQNVGSFESAQKAAPHWIKDRIRICRGGGMPLEPRGVIAQPDNQTGELKVWSSTQEPHTVRDTIATVLNRAPGSIRVLTPDTGGGFGTKLNVYPEEVLVPWLALRLKRPVKWVETRSEHMLVAQQERDQIHDIEVGFDSQGRILAVKDKFLHDTGAYAPRGGAVPHNTSSALPGPYRIPTLRLEVMSVYTNKVTVSAYRGAGQPQGTFVMERVIDRVARFLSKDPAEVRRINTIPADAFPYNTGLSNLLGGAVEYDSGDFDGVLQKALNAADYEALRGEQRRARAEGRLVGLGIGSYVELTGRGPWEGGIVRIEKDGQVVVSSGAPSQGQGHATTMAQICAEYLGASLDQVKVISGDTALIPYGIGTFASRYGVLGGNAVRESSIAVKQKVLKVAADLFEAAEEDLEVGDGEVWVTGVRQRKLTFAEIARTITPYLRPDPEKSALEATTYFKAPKMTYSNGTHLAYVEVDKDTGEIRILKYVVAHDCGRMINPTIVDGQVQGGVACGIGNAMLELHIYDQGGQLLTGSFMDYCMPRADDVPKLTIVHQEHPSTLNPLGVKGAGEAGTIPVPAAICNAVEDALSPLGIDVLEAPLTPYRLWRLIQDHSPV